MQPAAGGSTLTCRSVLPTPTILALCSTAFLLVGLGNQLQAWGPLRSKGLSTALRSPATSNSTGTFVFGGGVPRRVFQIALGAEYFRRIRWEAVRGDLMAQLPWDFEYELLTDRACEDFIARYYPEHVALYTRQSYPAWKSDLVRYLLMYKYGGVYIDVDMRLLLPLHDIVNLTDSASQLFVIGAKTSVPYEGANGFIMSPPGDPLFLRLVKGLYEDAGSADYGVNVKRLYAELQLRFPGIGDFKLIDGAFFLREQRAEGYGGYVIQLDSHTVCVQSNGNGWPPRIAEP
jgi:hypothetical protein